jgi:hypothetical protein
MKIEEAKEVDEFNLDQILESKGNNSFNASFRQIGMGKSMKVPIESLGLPQDENDDHSSSMSSAVDLKEKDQSTEVPLVMEKIDMRGIFRVNGALMTYSVQSSTKGFHFTLDTKTDNCIEKLFRKQNFAPHVQHSAHGKLLKSKSQRITARKLLKNIHEAFREELESLCAVIVVEDKHADTWIPTLKEAINEKFCAKN